MFRASCSKLLLANCLSWLFTWSLGQLCFDDGIPEAQRKNLQNLGLGTAYPVGVWANDWAAGHLTATMAIILIKEKLGYHAEKKGPGPLALDGFYALTGCTAPSDALDQGCGPTTTYIHVNVEVWTATYQGTWDEIQLKYPEMAPKSLGNMGYYGATAMYVPSAVQARAYDAEGINLDFFRDYNATRKTPGTYFASPGDLNVSFLYQCNETALMLDEVTQNYLNLTGDTAGVEVSAGGTYNMKCFDTYFWYAPECRASPSSCVTWFTGGQGWGMFEMLVKATSYNMPLATAVASSFSNYGLLPTQYDMMLYWWVPDPTFLRLTPRKITFPEHDSDAWARQDRRTAARDVSIEKHVSQDLSDLAPEVEELIAGLSMSIEKVNVMLLDQLNTEGTDFEVACRWLRANEADWSSWLPENGKCFSQFGMYNEQTQQFLTTREGTAISCRACPSGYYSSRLEDDQGITFVCKPCESGFFQESGASTACKACPAGYYQNDTASVSCNRCKRGEYQDLEGSSACKLCPQGTSTLLLGSLSINDCGCEEGSINTGAGSFQCTSCGIGLDCPFASTLATLKSGQAGEGNAVPRITAGFYSTNEEPLNVLQCRPLSYCPGGLPGACSGGLEGIPCAVCPAGQAISSGSCADCGAATALWAVALPISALWPIVAYYFTNLEVLAQPTPLKAIMMATGIGASCLQSVAVFGLMSTKWPATFEATSSSLQIVLLDLDVLSASCVSGTDPLVRYLLSLAIFPAFVLWLATCFMLSWALKASGIFGIRAWKVPYFLNTAGLGLQLGYGTMAAVAMKPLMCYQHPDGRSSLVIYPNLFCGETDHHIMQAAGLSFCLIFVLGFFGYCSYAAWKMPTWCAKQQIFRVQCFRFFLANFRFDAHWFVLLVLLRGLGFALSVVVGTNLPPAQTALASLILTVYGLSQAVMLPWKVPMINIADMLVNCTLLLLINKGIQVDQDLEYQFAEIWTVCMFLFLLFTIVMATLLSLLALTMKLLGFKWQRFLTLGSAGDHHRISLSLLDCAQALTQVKHETLADRLAMTNIYDVKTLLTSIDLLVELMSDNESFKLVSQTSLKGRVRKTAVNSRLSLEESLMLGLAERNTGQSLDTREFNEDLADKSAESEGEVREDFQQQDGEDPLHATSF